MFSLDSRNAGEVISGKRCYIKGLRLMSTTLGTDWVSRWLAAVPNGIIFLKKHGWKVNSDFRTSPGHIPSKDRVPVTEAMYSRWQPLQICSTTRNAVRIGAGRIHPVPAAPLPFFFAATLVKSMSLPGLTQAAQRSHLETPVAQRTRGFLWSPSQE